MAPRGTILSMNARCDEGAAFASETTVPGVSRSTHDPGVDGRVFDPSRKSCRWRRCGITAPSMPASQRDSERKLTAVRTSKGSYAGLAAPPGGLVVLATAGRPNRHRIGGHDGGSGVRVLPSGAVLGMAITPVIPWFEWGWVR